MNRIWFYLNESYANKKQWKIERQKILLNGKKIFFDDFIKEIFLERYAILTD